jgi:hypothetical protein
MANQDEALRAQLVDLLKGGNAHATLDDAVDDFPAQLYGKKPDKSPHSAWELLEHLRFTLHDLLDYCTNPEYVDPSWPDDYWPQSSAPAKKEDWQASVKALKADMKSFEDLIRDPSSNLYAEIPWAKDHQTLLREVLLAADHNSYHIGELVLLRRILGVWKS